MLESYEPDSVVERLNAIDVAVFDELCSTVGEPARESWACLREDHAGHLTYLEHDGFTERFRSWMHI